MGTLLTTVVAVALPVIGSDLRLSYSEALWVQAIYVLAMSVFLIPVGRLADKHGRLRFYLMGLGIFGGLLGRLCARVRGIVPCFPGDGGFQLPQPEPMARTPYPQSDDPTRPCRLPRSYV
jgi:MFS family permease